MASEKAHLKNHIKTEDARPFNSPKLLKLESFYYDRLKRNNSPVMTNGHYHNMYEIYFLLEGACRYFIEDKLFDIQAGDLVLISKGVIHKTIYLGKPTDRFLINFSKPYISPSLALEVRNLFSQNIYRPNASLIPSIQHIFDKIAEENAHSDNYSKQLITGYMTELFSLMLRHPTEQHDRYCSASIPIESITQYITQHFKDSLTLEQMASMASLSTSYFSRLFKNFTGFGFKEYLTIIRLKEAQSRLVHTDKSICKIAYECGFNDSNYFSSVFKELNGVSPLRYRKQNRIKTDKTLSTSTIMTDR